MNESFLDRYVVVNKIGEGSFSEVLKVRDVSTGNCYAAKRLSKVYKTMDDVLSCTEIKAIRNLEYHPNVVKIVDVVYDEVPGSLTLLFKLMDMSMYDYIKNRKRCLSEARVQNFLYQLVSGLHHLHKSGIFHRDIKPENILVKISENVRNNMGKTETVQIADLGSVCDLNKPPPHSAYTSTRWYRSPECLLTAGYYGAKMDIWALGCVYFEMLTLSPLFPGDNELDQLHKIHDVLGSPSQRLLSRFKHRMPDYKTSDFTFPKRKPIGFYNLVPMLSDAGIDILRRMLQYHPDMRISVFSLIDHFYFNDFKSKKRSAFGAHNSTSTLYQPSRVNTNRSSLCSSSSTDTTTRRTKTKSRRTVSNCDSSGGSTTSTTKSLESYMQEQRIKNLRHSTVLKERERAWGMNPGPCKTALIRNINRRTRDK